MSNDTSSTVKKMRTVRDLYKLLPYAYWCANGRPMPSWTREEHNKYGDGWRESCKWPRVDIV